MYRTHTLAFQRIFVRMKIISLISMRFSYVSLIRNSVTGPLAFFIIFYILLFCKMPTRLLRNSTQFCVSEEALKADFQSSHEAPRSSLRVLASN
jgi:hypothetical protein